MNDFTDQFDLAARQASALRLSHPEAPALDVLDLVMRGRTLTSEVDPTSPMLAPHTPFGQLIAEAFDRGTTPAEWRVWTSPGADPGLITLSLQIWSDVVIPRFIERFGVDGPATKPEPRWRGHFRSA